MEKYERPPNFRVVNFCNECKYSDSTKDDECVTCVLYDLGDIGYFKDEWVCDSFEHWEEIPVPEYRKRPKEKKKVTLWIGIGLPHMDNESYRTSFAWINKDNVKFNNELGIYPVTIEVNERDNNATD